MTAPVTAPAPPPGSARDFMLLYSPPPRRGLLRTLLALATELAAGGARRLDQGIARLRLEWWDEEARRLAAGTPTHPWLRGQRRDQAELSAALAPLVQACVQDLASEELTAGATPQLAGQLFVQSALLLAGAPLAPAARQALAALGRCVAGLEELASLGPRPSPLPETRASAGGPAGAGVPAGAVAPLIWLRSQQLAGPLLEPTLQPTLAPLLVWVAVAAHQEQRRGRRAARKSATIAPSPLDGFVDNIVAWRCARGAVRGAVRIAIDERFG